MVRASLLFTALFVLIAGSAFAGVYLDQPTSGTLCQTGVSRTVGWHADGFPPTGFDIQVSTNGGSSWTTIANLPSWQYSYSWTPSTVSANTCVKVIKRYGAFGQESSQHCGIIVHAQLPTITVTYPNGSGIHLPECGMEYIAWSRSGSMVPTTYEIWLSTNGGSSYPYYLGSVPGYQNYFLWQRVQPASWNDRIKVIAICPPSSQVRVSDESNNVFYIDAAPAAVTVTSPNGGEALNQGYARDISWSVSTQCGTPNYFHIQFSSNGGTSWTYIATYIPGSARSWTWSNPGPASNQCKVRVWMVYTDGASVSDVSNYNFVIGSTPVVVGSPNGGESLCPGYPITVTWSQRGFNPGLTRIYLINDGNGTVSTLASLYNLAQGEHSHSVTTTVWGTCRIRVQCVQTVFYDFRGREYLSGQNVSDYSDSGFLLECGGLQSPPDTPDEIDDTGAGKDALSKEPESSETELAEADLTADQPSLLQNYPNPFNPITQIAFNLAEAANVSLRVFNVVGQEVGTLVNGPMNAGQHTVSFNGRDLPSGIYLYRLQAGDRTEMKKMTLLK